MEDDEEVVEFAVEVAADGYLLGDSGGSEIQVGQSLQLHDGLFEDLGDVAGLQAVVLQGANQKRIRQLLHRLEINLSHPAPAVHLDQLLQLLLVHRKLQLELVVPLAAVQQLVLAVVRLVLELHVEVL